MIYHLVLLPSWAYELPPGYNLVYEFEKQGPVTALTINERIFYSDLIERKTKILLLNLKRLYIEIRN